MSQNKKPIEPKCKNCLCFNRENQTCRVAILIEGKKYNMPVSPEDNCHLDELGIPVEQVRWFEDEKEKSVKIEYPVGFFGEEEKIKD